MTIQEKINADLKTGILEKNEIKKSILRVLIGEFNRVEKNEHNVLVVSDEKAIQIIKKIAENAKIINDKHPSDTLTKEIEILETYLPKQLSDEELTSIIVGFIDKTAAVTMKDMGKIMNELKVYAGRYDGKKASEIIKSKLS